MRGGGVIVNSKEALEILYNIACIEAGQKQQYITYAKEIEHNEKVKELYNSIKQAIERLEALERNSNKVIKDSVKLINRNLELQQENEKLKKALEILKSLDEIYFFADDEWGEYRVEIKGYRELTKDFYDLLKEVLGDA